MDKVENDYVDLERQIEHIKDEINYHQRQVDSYQCNKYELELFQAILKSLESLRK